MKSQRLGLLGRILSAAFATAFAAAIIWWRDDDWRFHYFFTNSDRLGSFRDIRTIEHWCGVRSHDAVRADDHLVHSAAE